MGAGNVALGVVIGGAVGATFGKALSDSSAKIEAFKQKAEKVRGFHSLIGDTIRLRGEMERMVDKSGAAFGKLLKAHESNIEKLKSHGFAVHQLDKDYVRLGRTLKGLELGVAGRAKIGQGIEQAKENWHVGAAVTAAVAAPTMVSANYQAIIRDIAIKGGFANTAQEKETSDGIRDSASRNGISRDELANAINQLVAGGMDAKEALSYADVIAKFSIGQGASTEETAKMIRAISQNAQIKDPTGMNKALEAIAYLGQAGNFESPDMAKAFPGLLAEMQKIGIVGQDSVTQLGAMLQVQMKVTGSADEAATNLKNWFSKIGSDETKKNYEKAGIDYEQSMKTNIAKGWSTLEASLGIAKDYIEKIDPEKAKELKKFAESMDKVSDPEKRQAQIKAFEEVMKTGDLFNDMQVKAALTAYMQNSDLYAKLKKEAAQSNGLLEKNLKERQEMSQQKWRQVGQAMDEALARIGDAIRPATDALADGLKWSGDAIAYVADKAPGLAGGLLGLGAAMAAFKMGSAAWKIGGGALDIARGAWLARGAGKLPGLGGVIGGRPGKGGLAGKVADVIGAAAGTGAQPVFVTNWPGGGIDLPDGKGGGKKGPLTSKDKLGRATHIGKATTVAEGGASAGRVGVMARLGAAVAGVAGAGKAALAAPTLGAVASGGAGTLAAGGGMVAGAGVAGYAIGSVINAGINKAVSAATGQETSLGAWLYDKLHPESADPGAPAAGAVSPKGAAMPQQFTFSPSLQVTVQGDAKDPRQIANDLMPHLRHLFEQFQAQAARGAMFDPAHS